MSASIELKEIHWLIDMIQNIDVGLVIIDLDMNVKVWNGFMENHSGILTKHIVDKKLTDTFEHIPKRWLQQKIDTVSLLKNKAFTTWEQRPYLFKFKSYRPITSNATFMYQNVTFLPLSDIVGKVTQICMIIYDVTDVALNRLALHEAHKKLEHDSHTDSLTQLHNHGFWKECCQQEYKRYIRTQQNVSLLMIDIDHFKNINDTYGHPFGDKVLQDVAQAIQQQMRSIDIAGRYGGEEFSVLLIDSDLEQAKVVAKRISDVIKALSFKDKEIELTISIGIASLNKKIESYQQWINIADKGLYIAKNAGRDQIGILKEMPTLENDKV
ncbi:diguanylate cyclase [Psychromonas sp. CNPT3]|uniref:sensor domain-containing diguanylate cyclase n=1 Tax=Psychromonas sp. CNPT3 TaxID=314282 RepID=UPI00006E85B5|nr:diguanylate cyclase [Psychromonas sp. CNPT3]AGH81408.1 diguanylate cyclase [Psychromonas sp. CNPT3]